MSRRRKRGSQEKPTEFGDARTQAFAGLSEDELTDTTQELSLSDLKGSRDDRGYPEWQPKGRAPGEDTTGRPAPAVPARHATGAGPME